MSDHHLQPRTSAAKTNSRQRLRTPSPVRTDSYRVIAVGTVLCVVAGVVSVLFRDVLASNNMSWVIASCWIAAGFGIWGWNYVSRHDDPPPQWWQRLKTLGRSRS